MEVWAELKSIMETTEKASREMSSGQGDYFVDGLLYCHKCGTPKQCRVTMLGQEMTPYCLCKCESERLAKRESEKEDRQRVAKIERLRREGLRQAKMYQWTLENDDGSDARLSQVMRKYVDNFPELRERGKGLLLYGATGTGKTYAACAIANALIDRGIGCRVTSLSGVVNALGDTWGKLEYLNRLMANELIVFDDFGVERQTEYAREQIYGIINARCESGKPIIVTTNMGIDEIKTPTNTSDRRIYQRVLEMCFPVEVNARNRRWQNIRDDYAETKKILGLDEG